MDGQISSTGTLMIKRGKEMKECICPFRSTNGLVHMCGTWCPLFGDIRQTKTALILELCQKDIVFDSFADTSR